jgi:Protein of unknown function (DUF3574)
MKGLTAGLFAAVFVAGVGAGTTIVRTDTQRATVTHKCGAASNSQLRTTLYFGLARPKGSVSELEWQMFLHDEVTARFPAGLTVWEAAGQWRGADGVVDHEHSKVLLLVHPDTAAARDAVQMVAARYRKMFDQQSVLWESAEVCAAS